jgi:hypothetical protein
MDPGLNPGVDAGLTPGARIDCAWFQRLESPGKAPVVFPANMKSRFLTLL